MNATPECPPKIDLPTTLDRVGMAMQDLGKMITAVEANILDGFQTNGSEITVPPHIQRLDLALQMIEELSKLMQRLSNHPLPEVRFSADSMITPIRLERLRNLIATGKPEEDAPRKPVHTGHVSLF